MPENGPDWPRQKADAYAEILREMYLSGELSDYWKRRIVLAFGEWGSSIIEPKASVVVAQLRPGV